MSMNYGSELKRLRKLAGILQAPLADRMGVDFTLISMWETGRRPISEADFLRAKAALIELVAERNAAWEQTKRGALG